MKNLLIYSLLILVVQSGLAQPPTGLRPMNRADYLRVASNLPSTTADRLPPSVDLSTNLPPVGDQSPQNSCVAWAIGYYARSYYQKSSQNTWNYISPSGTLNFNAVFSPSYLYNQINGGMDQGSNFYTALSLLKDQGISTLATMPYQPFLNQPSLSARAEAAQYKIKSFRRLGEIMDPLLEAKEQLAQGHPVVVSAKTDLDYFNRGFANNRPAPYVWRTVGNNIHHQLNHAILLVGYDDAMGAFKFVNSWGNNWGTNGFGWIRYNIYNTVVSESFIFNPILNGNNNFNAVVHRDNNVIDAIDRSAGFDLSVTSVGHMNSMTHPQIAFNDRFMRITGNISLPAQSGRTAQVVVYFYKVNANGTKGEPVKSLARSMSLPNGNLITFTPPLSLNNSPLSNFGWFTDIKYITFDLPRGVSSPIRYDLVAEPALLIDGYPVRIGQSIPFWIIH